MKIIKRRKYNRYNKVYDRNKVDCETISKVIGKTIEEIRGIEESMEVE